MTVFGLIEPKTRNDSLQTRGLLVLDRFDRTEAALFPGSMKLSSGVIVPEEVKQGAGGVRVSGMD
jgi:hypothetical protein